MRQFYNKNRIKVIFLTAVLCILSVATYVIGVIVMDNDIEVLNICKWLCCVSIGLSVAIIFADIIVELTKK